MKIARGETVQVLNATGKELLRMTATFLQKGRVEGKVGEGRAAKYYDVLTDAEGYRNLLERGPGGRTLLAENVQMVVVGREAQ